MSEKLTIEQKIQIMSMSIQRRSEFGVDAAATLKTYQEFRDAILDSATSLESEAPQE